jgi:hypothetical protein
VDKEWWHVSTVRERKQSQIGKKAEAMIAAKIMLKIQKERSERNSEMFTTGVWDTFLHNIRTGIVGEYHKIEGLTRLALHVFCSDFSSQWLLSGLVIHLLPSS